MKWYKGEKHNINLMHSLRRKAKLELTQIVIDDFWIDSDLDRSDDSASAEELGYVDNFWVGNNSIFINDFWISSSP